MRSMSSTVSKIESLAAAADLPQRLAAALRLPRPQEEGRGEGGLQLGHLSMAPELSYGRHRGPAPYTARAAAVVLLLFRRGGRWHIPLTERPATLAHHAGQISLPGGAVDAGESSNDAAIRELNEELGYDEPIEVLGRLSDCYVF